MYSQLEYDNINNVITAVFADRMCVVKSTWPKLDSVHDYNEKRIAALLAMPPSPLMDNAFLFGHQKLAPGSPDRPPTPLPSPNIA